MSVNTQQNLLDWGGIQGGYNILLSWIHILVESVIIQGNQRNFLTEQNKHPQFEIDLPSKKIHKFVTVGVLKI
jgi:hypothetical protein